jgi:hypothetical protein
MSCLDGGNGDDRLSEAYNNVEFGAAATVHEVDVVAASGSLAVSVPTADDWTDIGNPVINVESVIDARKRMYGKTPTLHYRILLTTIVATYASPVAAVLGKLDEHGWLVAREIIRKEQLRHTLFGSVAGYVLKARRYGELCACVDPHTHTITDADCADCFGTGYLKGFYPALECQYADVTPEKVREYRNTGSVGMEAKVAVVGRFLMKNLLKMKPPEMSEV